MAGGGGWLAFCMLARHVAVMVEGLFILLVLAAEARGACPCQAAVGSRTCGPWERAETTGGHKVHEIPFHFPV